MYTAKEAEAVVLNFVKMVLTASFAAMYLPMVLQRMQSLPQWET